MFIQKSIVTTASLLLLLGLAFAEEAHHKSKEAMKEKKSSTATMQGGQGMHQGMMAGDDMPGMMKMHMMGPGMGHCMMAGKMAATNDGGVVVLMGMTLYKYDKNMKLVKQTDVPLDREKMHKNMKSMHEMMQKMHGEKMEQGKR